VWEHSWTSERGWLPIREEGGILPEGGVMCSYPQHDGYAPSSSQTAFGTRQRGYARTTIRRFLPGLSLHPSGWSRWTDSHRKTVNHRLDLDNVRGPASRSTLARRLKDPRLNLKDLESLRSRTPTTLASLCPKGGLVLHRRSVFPFFDQTPCEPQDT
jgi:hypothetical protein